MKRLLAPRESGDGVGSTGGGASSRARKAVVAAGRGAGRAGAGAAKGFWSGFRSVLTGARFVYLDNPGLVRLWIWPLLITVAVFAVLATSVALWHDDLLGLMWSEPAGEGLWVRAQQILRPVARVVLFLVLFALCLFVLVPLASLVAGPFNGMLAEEVERISKGLESPPFSLETFLRDMALTLRLEVGKLVVFALVMAPLFVVSLTIPLVGQLLYTLFGAFFTASYNAVDYTDWPLARRGIGVGGRYKIVRGSFLRMLGLGTAVWVVLLVPILGLLVMPAAVAGGTLMILDMEEDGLLDGVERSATTPQGAP